MVSERVIKLVHFPLFVLLTVASIIALAIASSVVARWNELGNPEGNSLRDRSRIALVAALWLTVFGIYLTVGVLLKPTARIFGILIHLVALLVGFILFLIAAASLTARLRGTDCGDVTWPRCNVAKGLMIMSWIVTVISLIALIFIGIIGVKARSGLGMRKSSLIDA